MRHYKIPHITTAIKDFLKTEEGKKVLLDYVYEKDAIDYDLIKEMKDFAEN